MYHQSGHVMTVLGPKYPEDLGITLCHEHLLVDFTIMYQEPKDPDERQMTHVPIRLENLGRINYNPFEHLENLRLNEEDLAVEEVQSFRVAGGCTIVDCTINGMGRDPEGLRRISQRAGVNIISSTGFYVYLTHPKDMNSLSVEDLKEKMVADIEDGVGDTGIKAGFVKIGNSFPWHENERKVCKAAVRTQLETGVPLSMHPGRNRKAPFEILEFLKDEGAQLDHVVMCHLDRTVDKIEEFKAIADFGCYLEMDLFGYETHFPLSNFLMPNDAGRIRLLKALITEGYVDRVLLSHDTCWKTRWKRYGGYGIDHILKHIVPNLLEQDVSRKEVEQILKHNPRNLFTIK